MPIILPDNSKKKAVTVVEMGKEFNRRHKQAYAEAPDMEGMRKEALMITAKYMMEAMQSGDHESFVEAFKQMLELCED